METQSSDFTADILDGRSRSTVALPGYRKKSRTHCRRASTLASEMGNNFRNRKRQRWTCCGISKEISPSEVASKWSGTSTPQQHQCVDPSYGAIEHDAPCTRHRCWTTTLATTQGCWTLYIGHRMYQFASYQQQSMHRGSSPTSRRTTPSQSPSDDLWTLQARRSPYKSEQRKLRCEPARTQSRMGRAWHRMDQIIDHDTPLEADGMQIHASQ